MLKDYIDKLIPIIKEMCNKNKTGGHDINHFLRTMKIALYLQTKEGGDQLIIGIASFLHDVHRLMQSERNEYVMPKDSLDRVLEIVELANLDLSDEQINKICTLLFVIIKNNYNI